MKKVEIKKLNALNVFKVLAYTFTAPILLISTFGMFMTPGGLGVIAVLFGGVIAIGFYGLFAMLITVVYNFFADKFGGLELQVEIKEDDDLYETYE